MQPIIFNDTMSLSDIKQSAKSRPVLFTCKNCGCSSRIMLFYFLQHPMICKRCNRKLSGLSKLIGEKISQCAQFRTPEEWQRIKERQRATFMKKYGCHPASRPEQIQRTKQTCQEKYGTDAPLQNEQIKTKAQQRCEQLYGEGIINPFQAEEVKNKIKAVNFERYGAENPQQNPDIKARTRETCTAKYGGTGFASDEIKEKYHQTCLAKYGVDNSNSAAIVKSNRVQKLLERYGSLHVAYAHLNRPTTYELDNITFQSFPEVVYYLYHKEHGDTVKRGPTFEYKVDDTVHRYLCDFEVNGAYIEIKGDHLWKDNKLYCPFRDEPKITEAKTQCMKDHNVRLVLTSSEEFLEMVAYFKSKYGATYLAELKNECKRTVESSRK